MSKSLSGPVKNSITGKTNKVVIFFHGYGADGNDLISLSDSFVNTLPDAVYYSPNAPEKCEMGGLGYQWFPIKQNNDGSLDLNAEKEIMNSIGLINDYIDEIENVSGVNTEDFILVGFSQGTMMILETLLSREKAVKQKAWHDLQESFAQNKVVTGVPFNRVKGGMSVDLDGVTAFLPGSQIDTRQIIKDTKELLLSLIHI